MPIEAVALSPDGRRVALQRAVGGTERRRLHVLDVDTGEELEPPIVVGRAATVTWLPGGEAYLLGGEGPGGRALWHHVLGEDHGADALVHGDPGAADAAARRHRAHVDPEGGHVTVTVATAGRAGSEVHLAALADLGPGGWQPIHPDGATTTFARIHRGMLLLTTDAGARRGRVLVAPVDRPHEQRVLVEEQEGDLRALVPVADVALLVHRRGGVDTVAVHDLVDGAVRQELSLSGRGSMVLAAGSERAWLGYSDFATPLTLSTWDPARGLRPWAGPVGGPSTAGAARPTVVTERPHAPAPDGTSVPLWLIRRHDVDATIPRPAIVYVYGGFGVALTPAYSTAVRLWVEAGGLYVVAAIRGGGELGRAWHEAGRGRNRSRSVDDLVAVAGWLVAAGWTSPDRLGLTGSSHGGLMVAAAAIRRPDLFSSVVCTAAPLDMVRYERSGVGVSWREEYGSPSEPDDLRALLTWSPYHRVEPGPHPAWLLTTLAEDARVDPAHARKLAARLQTATTSSIAGRPIVHRVLEGMGHGTRAAAETRRRMAETLTWHAAHLGLDLGSVSGRSPG